MLLAGGKVLVLHIFTESVCCQCVVFFLRWKKESLLHATRVVQGQFAGTSMTYMRGERKV